MRLDLTKNYQRSIGKEFEKCFSGPNTFRKFAVRHSTGHNGKIEILCSFLANY